MTSNVTATSTTGLYGISSNVRVPNSAQQLLNLLYSNGNVNFSLATGNTQVQANAMVSSTGGSTYGNSNVASYLASNTDPTVSNLNANAAVQAVQINTINANLGAFQTYANATFSTSSYGNTQATALLANFGSNAIVTSGNITGGYFVGNAAALDRTTGVATGTYGSDTIIPTIIVDAKGRITQITTNAISGGGSYGNANVAAFLPTYTGDLNGSLRSGNVYSTGTVVIQSATGQAAYFASGAGANVFISADGYLDLTGNLGIVINSTPRVNVIDGNLNVYKNTFTNANGSIYVDNNLQAGVKVVAPAYTFANGVNILDTVTGTYSNTNVAAYLDGSVTTVKNTSTNLTLTGGTASLILAPGSVGGVGGPVVYAANSSNIAAQGGVYSTTGYFWANGTAYSTASTYGNTQVAAYLPTYTGSLANSSTIQTINANLGAYQTYGNVTFSTQANAASQQTSIDNINANIGGSQTYANVTFSTIANAASQQTQIDGILNGTTTLANVKSTGGYFWANGTAYSTGSGSAFTGNLAGSTLYDSVNERIIANAFPLSMESTSIPNNATSKFIVNEPNYISGVLQQPPLANATPGGTGIVNTSSQVIGMVQSANIGFQSGYGFGSQNRDTVNFVSTVGVTPVTANTMANQDRVRAGTFNVDLNLTGQTYGLMSSTSQNASPMAGVGGVVSVNGYGNISAVTGGNYGTFITPAANQTANIQYTAGIQAFTNLLNTAGTTGKANVVYCRGIVPFITGFSSNLTVQYAVGMHTYSGWSGTGVVGASNQPILGRFALLNEDVNTTIQSNGNLVITGNTSLGPIKETQFSQGNQTGTVTVNYFNGTVQTATLTGNITINTNNVTNMPVGGTVTLILTQDGTGSRLLTSNIKFAGGSKTLSTAAGAIDTVSIYNDGTNLLAALVKGYA